jgi:hypothetical protein
VNPADCLIVLDSHGTPVETWVSQDLNGPWDMTMRAEPGHAALFVSDVLNRTGRTDSAPPKTGLCNVVRVNIALAPGTRPRMADATVVGSGFPLAAGQGSTHPGPGRPRPGA